MRSEEYREREERDNYSPEGVIVRVLKLLPGKQTRWGVE